MLKEFLHRDYRGIEALLRDSPALLAAIGEGKGDILLFLAGKASGLGNVPAPSNSPFDMLCRNGCPVRSEKSRMSPFTPYMTIEVRGTAARVPMARD